MQDRKEHRKYLSDSKTPRIRSGRAVPPDAVNLAYTYAPLPSVEKNIEIISTANMTIGNADNSLPIVMWPNKDGLLCNIAGQCEIQGYRLLVTNVSSGDTPLLYRTRLKYCTYSQDGRAHVKVTNLYGKAVGIKWTARLEPVPQKVDLYYIDIYTEKMGMFSVTYYAIEDGFAGRSVIPEHQEQVQVLPFFTRNDSLKGLSHNSFYQTFGQSFGSSLVYVSGGTIEDTRTPISFRYSVRVDISTENGSYSFYTPRYYGEVLNEKSLLSQEMSGYSNGFKQMSSHTAADLVKEFIPKELDGLNNVYTYTVRSSDPDVKVSTRPDGLGHIYAQTAQDTGSLILPEMYKVFKENTTLAFGVIVELIYNDQVVKESVVIKKEISHAIDKLHVVSLANVFSTYSNDDNPYIPLTAEQLAKAYLRISLVEEVPVDTFIVTGRGSIISGDNGLSIVNYNDARRQGLSVIATYQGEKYYYAPTYVVIADDRKQIKPLPSLNKGPFESWYLRIQNGLFYKSTLDGGSKRTFVYFLPEYERQGYSPYPPYKSIKGEKAAFVGAYKVSVRYTPIVIDSNMPLKVQVNGKEVKVKNVNLNQGIIELYSKFTQSDYIEVDYYYLETAFTYKGFTDQNNDFWYLDVNPGLGHKCSFIDSDNKFKTEDSLRLFNKTIYLYLLPAGQIDDNRCLVPGSFNPNCIRHSFSPILEENAVLLGQIIVRPHMAGSELELTDTRARGGGIKSHYLTRATEIEPESEYYWDIGYLDGIPYMENGVGIIRLSKKLLKEYGGKFTREYIESVVKNYFAWGNLPIIEYVDMPDILLERPGHITIEKTMEQAGFIKPGHPVAKVISDDRTMVKPRHLGVSVISSDDVS